MKKLLLALIGLLIFSAGAFAQTATLTPSGATYSTGGGTFTFTASVGFSQDPLTVGAIGWTVNIPTGWALVSSTGPGSQPAGTTEKLEWFYTDVPASPATFTFVVSYPAGLTGNQTVTSSVVFRENGVRHDLTPAALTFTEAAANVAASITTPPASQTVNQGQTATFSVMAAGNPAPTFQWKKNGTDITNATNATLTIPNAQSTNEGSYTVTVTNTTTQVNTATSAAATLTVNTPPVISTQPQSQTVNVGTNVTLTVAATGKPTPTYHWKKGTAVLSDGGNISGASTATLTITAAQLADTGSYTVDVLNSVTSVTSNTAVVTVVVAPAAPTITSQPLGASKRVGASVTFTVAATGNPTTFTYQWKKGGTAISGATNASLTLNNLQATDASSYTVVVSNGISPDATSNAATLTVNPALAFTLQPVDAPVLAGSTAVFTVAATGVAPLTYQWYSSPTVGGTPGPMTDSAGKFAGTQTATLTISNAQTTDVLYYVCIVTESGGTFLSSSAAQLSIVPRVIKVVSQTAAPGATVVVPIQLVSGGDVAGLQFSLSFDPALLTYQSVALGANSTDVAMNSNVSQTASGKVGLVLVKPSDVTWATGTQEVVKVTFLLSSSAANGAVAPLIFVNTPLAQEVSSVQATILTAGYQGGQVTVLSGYEADMNGNGSVTVTDWVKIGRLVAQLDPAPTGVDFMKADCAPRSTLGNGALSVTDWVQAGRYAAQLDPLTPVGGPTAPNP